MNQINARGGLMSKEISEILELKNINSATTFMKKFEVQGAVKCVYGRNLYSSAIINNYNIDYVVDDYTDEKYFDGVPVIRTDCLKKEYLVVCCSGGKVLTSMKNLSLHVNDFVHYFEFKNCSIRKLPEIVFNENFKNEFRANLDKFEWVTSILSDELSRQIYIKLMKFRFTEDLDHLRGFVWKEDKQYFDDCLPVQSDEVFYDVGGFDGFTSAEFAKLFPNYNSIHVFEPDSINVVKSLNKLDGVRNVHVHQYGLSDQTRTIKFISNGSESKISECGTNTISVKALDSINLPPPTLIKIDIEGGEQSALMGASQTIAKYKPKIAVAVYHNPNDIWEIPKLILEFSSDYHVYLRHYTESIYETVMFFIPRTRND